MASICVLQMYMPARTGGLADSVSETLLSMRLAYVRAGEPAKKKRVLCVCALRKISPERRRQCGRR